MRKQGFAPLLTINKRIIEIKDKETPLLLVLSSWNNKEQTDEKKGFAPLSIVNKRNIEMKNKETPLEQQP